MTVLAVAGQEDEPFVCPHDVSLSSVKISNLKGRLLRNSGSPTARKVLVGHYPEPGACNDVQEGSPIAFPEDGGVSCPSHILRLAERGVKQSVRSRKKVVCRGVVGGVIEERVIISPARVLVGDVAVVEAEREKVGPIELFDDVADE